MVVQVLEEETEVVFVACLHIHTWRREGRFGLLRYPGIVMALWGFLERDRLA